MDQSAVTIYDVVTYPSFVIFYTHPNRLATIATLFGMKPAPVERCRVLEIGCFDGTNLAAMAMALPDSEFVGVDAAGTAIARGQAMAQDVGLKNLTLRHLDVMEMAPDYGQFDYIVVHGVYTWVPDAVARQIMAICKGSLAPQGVAYISYNTFPGCHNRVMIREMMQFHNRDFREPRQQMHEGLNLLKVLANSLQKDNEPYVQFLKSELDRLSSRELESLYHDELADVFAPLYFHQFMEQAQQQDLQFLGEADFFDMVPRGMTPKALEVLEAIGNDIVLREQYLDFMRGRHFRKTLLCHQNVALDCKLTPDHVRSYLVSGWGKPTTDQPNPDPAAKETFQTRHGAALTSGDPLVRSLFWYLNDIDPERIPFERLVTEVPSRARERLNFIPEPGQDLAKDTAEFVWVAYRAGLVDLHVYSPRFVLRANDRPLANPLARWQARHGTVVSTIHHRTLQLSTPVNQALLTLMDGTRDRAALRAGALELFASGDYTSPGPDGQPIKDPAVLGQTVDETLDDFLGKLAKAGVLIG